MKASIVLLPAAAFALAMSAPSVRADELPFEDGYLVRYSVSEGDFASFLPPNTVGGKLHLVWEDERRPAWLERVRGKLDWGEEHKRKAVRIRAVAADKPVPVRFDRTPYRTAEQEDAFRRLSALLDDERGLIGRELVRARTDAGDATVRTNAFLLENAESGKAVRWAPPAGTFALRVDQGAGQNVMFLSREDLEARWKRLSERNDWNALRTEMSFVRIAIGARFSDGGPAGRAWKAWLDGYLANHPAAWPRLVFVNNRNEAVEVFCRIDGDGVDAEGRPLSVPQRLDIPGRGRKAAALAPRGAARRGVTWSFRPKGGNLCEKDYGERTTEWRSDGLGDVEIEVASDRKPLPRPFFRIDETLLPHDWLRAEFEADRSNLRISAVYDDPKDAVELDDRIWRFSEEWPIEVDLNPHRPVAAVRIASRNEAELELLPTDFTPDKKSFCCGETVVLSGAPRLRPWPDLLLSNPTNVVVTNVVRLLSGGSEIARGEVVVPVGKQEVSVRGKFDAAANRAWDAAGVTNLAVEISPRAPSAWPSTVRFDVFRGQKGPVRRAPMPDVRNLDWVDHDVRISEIVDHWTDLKDNYWFVEAKDYVNNVRSNTNNVFHVLMVHLRDCEGCPECRKDDAFRRFHDQFERTSGKLAWTEAMAKAKPDDPDWNAARSWESDERTFVLACMLYEYLVDPEGDGHAENLDERKRIPDGAGTPAEEAIATARKFVEGLSVERRQGGVR